MPWLVLLSGLSASLRTKRSLVRFPVRAHAWVEGQVPTRGHVRGNHTLMFLSLSLPSLLSKNKYIKMWGTVTSMGNVAQPRLGKVSGERGWRAGPMPMDRFSRWK